MGSSHVCRRDNIRATFSNGAHFPRRLDQFFDHFLRGNSAATYGV